MSFIPSRHLWRPSFGSLSIIHTDLVSTVCGLSAMLPERVQLPNRIWWGLLPEDGADVRWQILRCRRQRLLWRHDVCSGL